MILRNLFKHSYILFSFLLNIFNLSIYSEDNYFYVEFYFEKDNTTLTNKKENRKLKISDLTSQATYDDYRTKIKVDYSSIDDEISKNPELYSIVLLI